MRRGICRQVVYLSRQRHVVVVNGNYAACHMSSHLLTCADVTVFTSKQMDGLPRKHLTHVSGRCHRKSIVAKRNWRNAECIYCMCDSMMCPVQFCLLLLLLILLYIIIIIINIVVILFGDIAYKRFRLLRSMLPFRGLSVVTFVHCAQTAEGIDTISFATTAPMHVSPRSL